MRFIIYGAIGAELLKAGEEVVLIVRGQPGSVPVRVIEELISAQEKVL